MGATVSVSVLSEIAALFPNVEILEMTNSVYTDNKDKDKDGIFGAVSRLPHLRRLSLTVTKAPPDVIFTLMRAKQGFVLELTPGGVGYQVNDCWYSLESVRQTWEFMHQHAPELFSASFIAR